MTRFCGFSLPESLENAGFFRCHYPARFSVKIRQLGLGRPVLKTVRAKAHAGSNPAPSAIKETSFVYGAREVSSCILGKKRAEYGEIGLRSGRSAALEPGFLRSSPENGRKHRCTFVLSLLRKERTKVFMRQDLNRIFTIKISSRVRIKLHGIVAKQALRGIINVQSYPFQRGSTV